MLPAIIPLVISLTGAINIVYVNTPQLSIIVIKAAAVMSVISLINTLYIRPSEK